MKKLFFLDVRNNKVSKLGLYAMNEFDSMAKQSENFTVDLGGKIFVCNCDSLWFVQWMVNIPIFMVGTNMNVKCRTKRKYSFGTPEKFKKRFKRIVCYIPV